MRLASMGKADGRENNRTEKGKERRKKMKRGRKRERDRGREEEGVELEEREGSKKGIIVLGDINQSKCT